MADKTVAEVVIDRVKEYSNEVLADYEKLKVAGTLPAVAEGEISHEAVVQSLKDTVAFLLDGGPEQFDHRIATFGALYAEILVADQTGGLSINFAEVLREAALDSVARRHETGAARILEALFGKQEVGA